jgi:nitric oxide dioxygenase
MLSEKTISIVKATVPALQENGETLTRHFYKKMFERNPEVRSFFNPANQASGGQQQALAGAICAYAANIDNLGVLTSAVELIAQKHASLRIKPEHYPIVGENLLLSIKEVLGEAATDEVITAWGEAYQLLADILIGRERDIYSEQSGAPGGWSDFKNFKVVKKQPESDVITSLYLEPEDGSSPPVFKPGQYISVRVPTENGETTLRNYSLSDRPGENHFRISVKREDQPSADVPGGFVSNLLHRSLEVGQSIELAAPSGEFFLDPSQDPSRPLVLLAAGVGVTPVLSMLLVALETMPDREIRFVYACLNERHQAFKADIDALDKQHANLKVHYCYSDRSQEETEQSTATNVSDGFVDGKIVEAVVGQKDADYYFCGPKLFMASVNRCLVGWNVPRSQIHFEFFGPKEDLENPPSEANAA